MHKKVTIPQIKKMLREQSPLEISVCSVGKDPNHIINAHMVANIEKIEDLDRVRDSWYEVSEQRKYQLCIWVEEDDE